MVNNDKPLPAGFSVSTCLVVSCRTCSAPFEDDESGCVLHFGDVAEAADRVTVDGWWFTQDGVQCQPCAARDACASIGHAWEPWGLCRCDGRLPAHVVQMETRHCASCGEFEEHPAVPVQHGDGQEGQLS